MYAVIRTGGKQYRVEEGDILRVERLNVEPKNIFSFDQVLFLEKDGDVSVGRPVVSGASVEAEVIRHARSKKIVIFKSRRMKTYRRTQGHRQDFTEVRIKGIKV
ncbi:MAG: 50S ribosomal protein L21 [Holophagales bacterium]|jgi:large subunit ribosomal protein L21|nr:50S ribosomal protein L21 [Holophagales bacterium]